MSIANLYPSGVKDQKVFVDELSVNDMFSLSGPVDFKSKSYDNIDCNTSLILNDVISSRGEITITNIPAMSLSDVIEFTVNLDVSKFSNYVPDLVFLSLNSNGDNIQNIKLSAFVKSYSAGQFVFLLTNMTTVLYTQSADLKVGFNILGHFQ
jgi:hypothetical protein